MALESKGFAPAKTHTLLGHSRFGEFGRLLADSLPMNFNRSKTKRPIRTIDGLPYAVFESGLVAPSASNKEEVQAWAQKFAERAAEDRAQLAK
ncbi:hypothetical protein WDZ92_04735 [Nostoc sp. NIES-2111]